MLPRRVSHMYYYTFPRMDYRLLMSICVFSLVVATTLVIITVGGKPLNEDTEQEFSNQKLKLSETSVPLEFDAENSNSVSVSEIETYFLEGNATTYVPFEGLGSSNKSMLKEITLRFVNLNAKLFTEVLQGCLNLKSIALHRVNLINDDFQRVYLPNLIEFSFDRTIGFHQQYRDYVNLTTADQIEKMLFFDKMKEKMDLPHQILTSNVDLTLRLDGWTVLCIKNGNDIVLALSYASEILKSVPPMENSLVENLTLTECFISQSVIPNHVKYLNLYNVGVNDGSVTNILSSMSQLTYLFLEAPRTIIELSHLPKTLKEISFSSVNMSYKTGDKVYADLIAFGSISEPNIIENFDLIFVNAKKIAIFELQGSQHDLLKNILRTNVEWIFFEKFERKREQQLTQVEQDIESLLTNLKLSSDDEHFLLEKNNGFWKGRGVSKLEIFKFRYNLLGWEKFITFDSYHELSNAVYL